MSNINCDKCGHLLPAEGECMCQCKECDFHPCGCPKHKIEIPDSANQPPPGSWADVARMMASLGGDDGIDWDAWKDEMKERDLD